MIVVRTATSQKDLQGILALQKANLKPQLSAAEIESQGFVTVTHSFNQLAKLNAREKHIIAVDRDKIVAYLLAMTSASKSDIAVLIPMFEVFDEIAYNNKTVADYDYIVVGQVCIDKGYRGQGILDQCYAAYKNMYSHRYDFAITEIATTNTRSRNAHKRIGFQEIKTYTAPDDTAWTIVIWDWQADSPRRQERGSG